MFFSLNTGKVLSRRGYTILPMPSNVIDRINDMGKDQPRLLTFADRDGNEILDDTSDTVASQETPHEIPGVLGDVTAIPGVNTANDMEIGIQPDDKNDPDNTPPPLEPITEGEDTADEGNNNDNPDNPTFEHNDEPMDAQDVETPTTNQPPSSSPRRKKANRHQWDTESPPELVGVRRSSRATKAVQSYIPSMKGKAYGYSAAQIESIEHDPRVVELVLTQLTLKAAIKMWGNEATHAAEAEMKQLHWRNSFKPVRWSELSDKQRAMVLESHMFMKQKQTGEIKGRTVAGGNKQRGFIDKEDASSPTVATESVVLTSVIDAEEDRETAVVDVPNAFIQTVVEDKSKRVIVRIRGILVDILVKIAPEVYKDYVSIDRKGQKQILVECLNALYGTMVASLLYYQKFTGTLKKEDFIMNPYDPCVWNKMIQGKQCTICFHVDDCKISHRSKKVVNNVIEWLRKDYESIFEDGSGKMKVNRGKVHKYLGMTLDFTTKGQVKISMVDFVKDIISTWEKAPKSSDDGFTVVKRGRKGKTTAAPEDLFKVNEDSAKLNQDMATSFHNIVAKALYLVKRARPDASVAIAFLTTRVRQPDEDDWRKLEHLIEYFKVTTEMPLILGGDSSGVLNWYVDASFAVHPNMRGHTGGGLTLGRGFPIVCSTKQKLNTRSSTESELVGVDDMMPSILWTRYFLKAQGYHVSDNIIFQDNKSSMLLERNGKASSSKRTKHINVRYFFVTDRISKGEVRVEWCPTKDMIADFMTKPLQGSLFKKFRDLIMGALPTAVKESGRKGLAHK